MVYMFDKVNDLYVWWGKLFISLIRQMIYKFDMVNDLYVWLGKWIISLIR